LLEQTLGLGFGYPAVVAISGSKRRFAVQRDAFSDANIAKFVKDIVNGKQSTSAVDSWPSLKSITPWDGKDAPLPPPEPNFDQSTDM